MNPDSQSNVLPAANQAPMPMLSPQEASQGLPSTEQPMLAGPEMVAQQSPQLMPTSQDSTQQGMNAITQSMLQTTTSTTAAPGDDDGDDFDKQWVLKAKQIVAQTGDNPYEQNKQLANVKADYLQKRYGKVIKLAE